MSWNDRTCDLGELEHVIHAHLDTPLTVDGLCRMTKEDLACAIIALRRDWHRESEVDSAEWEEDQERLKQAEARVAELEREVAWLRRWHGDGSEVHTCGCHPAYDASGELDVIYVEDVSAHLTSKPPEGWNIPVRENSASEAQPNP